VRRWLPTLTLLFPLALGAALLTAGCNNKKAERLSGGGSSFVDPIMQK